MVYCGLYVPFWRQKLIYRKHPFTFDKFIIHKIISYFLFYIGNSNYGMYFACMIFTILLIFLGNSCPAHMLCISVGDIFLVPYFESSYIVLELVIVITGLDMKIILVLPSIRYVIPISLYKSFYMSLLLITYFVVAQVIRNVRYFQLFFCMFSAHNFAIDS